MIVIKYIDLSDRQKYDSEPMKNMLGVCIVGVLLTASAAWSAKTDEPSAISAYAGKYKGTVLANGASGGSATGKFSASKRKENGKLSLDSTLMGPTLVTEKFSIRGKKYSYSVAVNGVPVGSGSGKAKVFKKSIKLTGSALINGSPFVLEGTVKKTKKGLDVTSNITGMGGLVLDYSLKKKGK